MLRNSPNTIILKWNFVRDKSRTILKQSIMRWFPVRDVKWRKFTSFCVFLEKEKCEKNFITGDKNQFENNCEEKIEKESHPRKGVRCIVGNFLRQISQFNKLLQKLEKESHQRRGERWKRESRQFLLTFFNFVKNYSNLKISPKLDKESHQRKDGSLWEPLRGAFFPKVSQFCQ